ncbi:MAG: carbon-nitrogen hydrolase family protein [Gemmatimonadetes bacterium]|nr:carbon-nitrogen hydrolase family protein [Gemmatimonadota bacterium]MYG22510.1 carbon-nitrogen hydrolase family protein [Gemmatimonadota bacterium]MYJ40235.1 carbon-nitrogen hydrolase family protein [Gemmatimonadota bacterium]
MPSDRLTVALVTDAFPAADAFTPLQERLRTARELGAQLAVLPELPLNAWAPLTRQPSHADGEEPHGPRHRALAEAARATGLAVLGGAIVRDAATGRRHNTALLFGADGGLRLRYRKVHLPDEEGYWEAHHYEPGGRLHTPARLAGWGIGVQICSDVNRPQGCNALAAMGAGVILVPRATPPETYPRWRMVLRANAVTSCAYVISVNRPGTGSGGVIGGPSIAIAPSGDVLLETTDPVAVVTLERAALETARQEYPGYLDVRPDVYEDAWRRARH